MSEPFVCDHQDGHALEQVEVIRWKTRYPDLNERYQTVRYACVHCPYERLEGEERTRTLSSFGGDE